MSKTTKWVVLVLVLAIIAGVWYYRVKPTTLKQTGPIKIGGLIMQTGFAAEYGANQTQAIELAKEEINKSGGILGRPVEFVLEDTKSDSKEGITAVNKLINIDKVDLIISFEFSGPSITGATVAQQNKKIFIVAVTSVPDITQGRDHIWRTAPTDKSQGRDLAKAVINKGDKNIAVLYINNDYGVGLTKFFEDTATAGGAKLVAKESFAENDTDFQTQLVKIKKVNPDALVLIASSNHYPLIIKQAKSLGIKAGLFGPETMKDEQLIKGLGSLAEGITFTSYSSPNSLERSTFIQKMTDKYGKEPGIFADFAYDAIFTAKEAIEKAGTTDSSAMMKALGSVNYRGATGVTEFNQDREVTNKPFSVYTVRNGQIILSN